MTSVSLRARDVSFAYEREPAVRLANVDVRSGEAVALVGPSGCGKSTLLSLLAGVRTPSSGSVTFGDQVISSMTDRERRQLRAHKFGFVMQFGALVPELTLQENVAVPAILRGESRQQAERDARKALELVGIGELAGRFAGKVSGGQRQRAALARALAGSPEIVFADEPTGALDSANALAVMDLLLDAAHQHHSSVLVITHDPALAARCDRVIQMWDGMCPAATGAPAVGAR